MWYPPPAAQTTAEARVQLLGLGALLCGRRPPRSPETLLTEVPPLLRLLKGRRVALERAGLRRAERIAATQLVVELHDAWAGGAAPQIIEPLQAALEAFCLRAATLADAGVQRSAAPVGQTRPQGASRRPGVPLRAPTLRLYRLSCASAQSRSACARR